MRESNCAAISSTVAEYALCWCEGRSARSARPTMLSVAGGEVIACRDSKYIEPSSHWVIAALSCAVDFEWPDGSVLWLQHQLLLGLLLHCGARIQQREVLALVPQRQQVPIVRAAGLRTLAGRVDG